MGYYFPAPVNHGKANWMVSNYGAQIVSKPQSFEDVPAGKGLCVVVDNGLFEAAGYVYNASEFDAFNRPTDTRPRTYLLMDKETAETESGYKR